MDIIVNEGIVASLNLIRSNADWTCALYTNTPTLDEDTIKSDFTLASFDGSTPIDLTNWGTVSVVDNRAQMIHDPISFELLETGPFTLNGAIVYDASNKLIMILDFDTPRELAESGDQLLLNLIKYKLFDSMNCGS